MKGPSVDHVGLFISTLTIHDNDEIREGRLITRYHDTDVRKDVSGNVRADIARDFRTDVSGDFRTDVSRDVGTDVSRDSRKDVSI